MGACGSIFLSGCAGNPAQAPLTESMRDCTEQAAWVGKPATDLPPEERARILEAATRWAMRKDVFPCDVTICGAMYDATVRGVSVWITGYGDYHPSVSVRFSRPGLRPRDVTWHEGVRCPGRKIS
jgi:hypothetical protein